MPQAITTTKAPSAIGPYSQAVKANGFIFVSGQIPMNPTSGEVLNGPVSDQVRQVLSNLSAILEAAGSSLSQVIKTTVYLRDMGDFEPMNKVYAEFFEGNKPARATVQAARLPRDVSVEIDAIAVE